MSGNRPARVGLVVGQLSAGGAEGQLWQLARGLDRARFEPIVYCLSSQSLPVGDWLRRDGVTLRVVEGRRRIRWLAQALATDGIALVHSWLYIGNALAWAAGWFSRSRPLITSARNCKVQGRVSWLANTLAFRASRAIVANSQDVATYIARTYRAPRQRIRVIYNGIDTERFRPQQWDEAMLGPVVTVGRVVEQKNHELFLQAAAQLAPEFPALRFIIVGDGPLRPMLEGRARALGIADRVTFAGERRDVETVLRSASLFWLTSRWEGMPNVVLEAMASGVPAIATDVGGTRELIRQGVDGFVVSSGDAEAVAQRSRELLADPSCRRRFADAARARAEEFSTPRMVQAMSGLYEEVLGGC